MTLAFVDDAKARAFAPFALTRPACELRVGAELVRRRWEVALGATTSGFLGATHLADFDEPGAAAALAGTIPAGSILVNARCAVSLSAAPADADAWACDGRLAAVRLRRPIPASSRSMWEAAEQNVDGAAPARVDGHWIDEVWDLVRHLPACLTSDIPRLVEGMRLDAPAGLVHLGQHGAHVEHGAIVEPHVVFDCQAGPVLVRRGAIVQAFTRLVGPCVIGEDTVVHGGRIATSSIGERSRVSGEVSTCVVTGHANKAHDGFLGHSVLGRWVNLGASTVSSNLKNTYGDVSLWTPDGTKRTGLQFLGALLGDHARTAIGTRLNTGTVIGAGANVFGDAIPPKVVAPFAWGAHDSERWKLDAFLATAERVMMRRDMALSEKCRRQLTAAFGMPAGSSA